MDCLEAALGSRHAFNRPGTDRLANSLDFVKAKIAQMEQIAEQPACGGRDDDRSRFGQGLKARCQVRRIPNHSMLAQPTIATEAADHH